MINSLCSEWLELFDNCAAAAPIDPAEILPMGTLAILNPPFGKGTLWPEVGEKFYLAHRWRSEGKDSTQWSRTNRVKQSAALEALFLELCVRSLAPGEVVVMLTPNGLLSDQKSGADRCWLLEQARLWASIQLPPEVWQAECKVGIVTSIVVLERLVPQELVAQGDYDIFMAMVKGCGFDSRGRRAGVDELPQVVDKFMALGWEG
ncbi:N-6 DNA methylase [Leptolyngbya sp. PCC 6406]|uniref:N-6 DNA methylase n=1 Tax=Leptolyngbya sp. PCC 6406 TaxID=1173264 RepID=UPI0002AC86F8|nr:N-6 DNA methylase [Leptolyngbya sp. PCC 6406]